MPLRHPKSVRPTRLYLTVRGRAVVVLVLVAALLGAFSLGRTGPLAAVGTAPSSGSAPVEVVTVQAGDSLWSMARRIAPDNDAREVVAQLRRLNDLPDGSIRAGQQLLLPVAG